MQPAPSLTEFTVPRLIEVLKDHAVGVLLAALAFSVVVAGGTIALLVGPYLALIPGLVWLETSGGPPSDTAVLMVLAPVMLLYLTGFFLFMVTLAATMGSLYRAFDAAWHGEAPVTWRAPFQSVQTHLWPMVLTSMAQGLLVLVGTLLLVLPGLLAAYATLLAVPAAALDGLGPREAFGRAVRHCIAHPVPHLGIGVGVLAASAMGSAIPLLGAGLGYTVSVFWLLAVYRTYFPREA